MIVLEQLLKRYLKNNLKVANVFLRETLKKVTYFYI